MHDDICKTGSKLTAVAPLAHAYVQIIVLLKARTVACLATQTAVGQDFVWSQSSAKPVDVAMTTLLVRLDCCAGLLCRRVESL